ncbi:MAG: hypothetical protein KDD43_05450, partial [Bdellovibrionales bacterium]|nr:hypothetical protein [Bdellovibrionales bacterium]
MNFTNCGLRGLRQGLRFVLCLQLVFTIPLAHAEEPLTLLYTRAIGSDLTQFLSGLEVDSSFFHLQGGMVYQATLLSKSILPDGTPYFEISLASPSQAEPSTPGNGSGTGPMPEGSGSGTGLMPDGSGNGMPNGNEAGNARNTGFTGDLINAGIASGSAIGGILIAEFSGLSDAKAEYDRNMGELRGRINEHREAIQNLISQINEDQLRAGLALTRTQEVLKELDTQAMARKVTSALVKRHQGWQSSPYTFGSFEFNSQDPEFLDRALHLRDQLSSAAIHAPGQALAYNVGQASLRAADKASVEGEKQLTQELLDVATVAADVLIGWDPFTGYARSFTEFFSGRNIITGEELGSIERTLAGFTLMTGVPGKPLSLTFRALSKATQHLPVISTRLAATLNRIKWAL